MTVDRFSSLKKGIESFHDLSFAHGGRGCKAPIRDRGFGSAPRVLSVIPVSYDVPADDPSKGNEISLFSRPDILISSCAAAIATWSSSRLRGLSGCGAGALSGHARKNEQYIRIPAKIGSGK